MHVAPLSARLYCFSLTSPSFIIIHLLATFAHRTNRGKNIPSPISAMAHPKKNNEGKRDEQRKCVDVSAASSLASLKHPACS